MRTVLLLLVTLAAACAPARPALPSGAGTPFPGFGAVYDEAVADCRNARTVVAELGLSGRAGGTRLRGRVTAGLAAPSDLRLEGVAFGRPVFMLVAKGEVTTLLLPRDDRVLRNAPADAIIEALAGVPLTPAQMRAVVAGCGLGVATPSAGRMFSNEWAAVEADAATTYLRKVDGRWRVGGATLAGLSVVYSEFRSGLPARISVRATDVADISLAVSQLEINTPIDPKAFELNVPASAHPLTLDELRRAGPLGERRSPPGLKPGPTNDAAATVGPGFSPGATAGFGTGAAATNDAAPTVGPGFSPGAAAGFSPGATGGARR